MPPSPSGLLSHRLRNVLSNWGGFAFTAGVNFFLAPFIVHRLGNTEYGLWTLLASLVGYLGLLDLGVRGAVTRFVARYHAAGDHAHASGIAATALALFTAGGVLAILCTGVLALLVPYGAHVPSELWGVTRAVLVLGGLNVAVSLVAGVFGGVVIGIQRFDYGNAVEVVVVAARAVAILVALREGYGLIALAVIQLASSLLRAVADFSLSRRVYPELRIAWRHWDRESARAIVSFGGVSALLQSLGAVVLYSDSLVIGALLPVAMITFFSIAVSLTEYARALVSGVSQTVTPYTSALEAAGRQPELVNALLGSARIATLIVLPIVITFLLRGGTFIGLWMGPEYAELSGQVLRILSLALWSVAGYQVITATMMGLDRHRGLVPGFLAEAICNLGLSILLIRTMGIVGSAWGTTLPRLVASLLFAPWYTRRVLGVPMRQVWSTVWIRPTLAMIPFALGSYAVEQLWAAPNTLVYFAQVAATLPLAVLGTWWICFSVTERDAYSRALRSRPAERPA